MFSLLCNILHFRGGSQLFYTSGFGSPVSLGCIMCLATNKRLEPGLPFPDFCEKYRGEGQAYTNDVDRARQAIIEETDRNANRTLPTFVPGCQVSQQRVYGHQVYTKAGLLTDAEVTSLVGKSAVALGASLV